MGQKVNPHGLRVGVNQNWDPRWYAKNENVGDLLVEDFKIRKFIKDTLYDAGIPKIEIERNPNRVRIFIHCARPGIVIGRGGADIEKLRLQLEGMIGKRVAVNIVEIRNPDLNAQLVAENIAAQIEKRVSFRRAMKQVMGRATRAGAKGIKTWASGRLGGAEIARTEVYHEGTIPLQTLRADIDYGFAEAKTQYGRIGIKVWIYRGEVLTRGPRQTTVEPPRSDRRNDRRDRRDRRDGDRRGGYNRDRSQGGYNRGDRAPGGYRNNNTGAPNGQRTGGYNNNRTGGQGGYNRGPRPQGAAPRAPRPAATAPVKPEGGNN